MSYLKLFDHILQLDAQISNFGGKRSEEQKLQQLDAEIDDVWRFYINFYNTLIKSPITPESAKKEIGELNAFYYTSWLAYLRNKQNPRKKRKKVLVSARKVFIHELEPAIKDVLIDAIRKVNKDKIEEFSDFINNINPVGCVELITLQHHKDWEKFMKPIEKSIYQFIDIKKYPDFKKNMDDFFRYAEDVLRGMFLTYRLIYTYPYKNTKIKRFTATIFINGVMNDIYDNYNEVPKNIRYYFEPHYDIQYKQNVSTYVRSYSKNIKFPKKDNKILSHNFSKLNPIQRRWQYFKDFINFWSEDFTNLVMKNRMSLIPELKDRIC